jgi:hypothetical protein
MPVVIYDSTAYVSEYAYSTWLGRRFGWWTFSESPEARWGRMLEDKRAAERQRDACARWEARRLKARRTAVRDVVATTQQLGAAVPDALKLWRQMGRRTSYGYAFHRFVADVRQRRFGLRLDTDQLHVFDRWAEATFDALAIGVDERLLQTLLDAVSAAVCLAVAVRRLFSRALSLQLRRLAHVIPRHAPPAIGQAGTRPAFWPTVGVMTTA